MNDFRSVLSTIMQVCTLYPNWNIQIVLNCGQGKFGFLNNYNPRTAKCDLKSTINDFRSMLSTFMQISVNLRLKKMLKGQNMFILFGL